MNTEKVCPYCGKKNPKDKRGRPVIFCSKEHRKLYTKERVIKDIHYCCICGEIAVYNEKYNRWRKTCGKPECQKKVASNAQKLGIIKRKRIIVIPKNEIIELYVKQNMSRADIAKHYKCSEANIKKYLRINKIHKGIVNRDVHTKSTKLKLHGNPRYVNVKKQRKTCLKKYGAVTNLCLYDGHKSNNFSKEEVDWIKSLNNTNIISHHIIKIENNKRIIVDGYDPTTNTVLEFLGDYWHGNLEVFKPNQINKSVHKRMKTLYKETFDRFDLIKSLGYNIIYIWENDYRQHKEPQTYQ